MHKAQKSPGRTGADLRTCRSLLCVLLLDKFDSELHLVDFVSYVVDMAGRTDEHRSPVCIQIVETFPSLVPLDDVVANVRTDDGCIAVVTEVNMFVINVHRRDSPSIVRLRRDGVVDEATFFGDALVAEASSVCRDEVRLIRRECLKRVVQLFDVIDSHCYVVGFGSALRQI